MSRTVAQSEYMAKVSACQGKSKQLYDIKGNIDITIIKDEDDTISWFIQAADNPERWFEMNDTLLGEAIEGSSEDQKKVIAHGLRSGPRHVWDPVTKKSYMMSVKNNQLLLGRGYDVFANFNVKQYDFDRGEIGDRVGYRGGFIGPESGWIKTTPFQFQFQRFSDDLDSFTDKFFSGDTAGDTASEFYPNNEVDSVDFEASWTTLQKDWTDLYEELKDMDYNLNNRDKMSGLKQIALDKNLEKIDVFAAHEAEKRNSGLHTITQGQYQDDIARCKDLFDITDEMTIRPMRRIIENYLRQNLDKTESPSPLVMPSESPSSGPPLPQMPPEPTQTDTIDPQWMQNYFEAAIDDAWNNIKPYIIDNEGKFEISQHTKLLIETHKTDLTALKDTMSTMESDEAAMTKIDGRLAEITNILDSHSIISGRVLHEHAESASHCAFEGIDNELLHYEPEPHEISASTLTRLAQEKKIAMVPVPDTDNEAIFITQHRCLYPFQTAGSHRAGSALAHQFFENWDGESRIGINSVCKNSQQRKVLKNTIKTAVTLLRERPGFTDQKIKQTLNIANKKIDLDKILKSTENVVRVSLLDAARKGLKSPQAGQQSRWWQRGPGKSKG